MKITNLKKIDFLAISSLAAFLAIAIAIQAGSFENDSRIGRANDDKPSKGRVHELNEDIRGNADENEIRHREDEVGDDNLSKHSGINNNFRAAFNLGLI